ncbi:MAG: C-type polyheme cytochrome OmcB [Anaerolineales bacterium]|nr:C-type polyheme cytochrome OmcB [Anaerolineales bacterium]
MRRTGKMFALLALLLIVTLVAAGCAGDERPAPEQVEVTREVVQEVTVPVEVTRVVEVTAEAGPAAEPEEPAEKPAQPAIEVPFLDAWSGSGHNDTEAEAFNHWNEDDPQEVSASCAKCHSTPGYQDAIGADGSEAGVVDKPAPIGTTVQCVACHNDVTLTMDSVVMPSGIELTGLGDEARCMQCHQGRQSTVSVDEAVADLDPDTVNEELGFLNIHYFAAAATKYGTFAKGGYEYDAKSYDGNFAHVEEFDACIECHNSHTLELQLDGCTECHADLASKEDLLNVRMPGSMVDYDSDGDVEEGIYYETEGLREKLYQAIQTYASEVSGPPIVYDAHSYPYFFIDTNENGESDEDEAQYGNKYNAWTPRLLKAAYNYQVSVKDPGEFAHGGKYIIQLIYDSTEDLNAALSEPVDLAGTHRIDAGHFAGSEEAFRHWDEDGEVSSSCSRCHSAKGLPLYLAEGVSIPQPIANGFRCRTCHDSLAEFTRYTVDEVEFPSGAVASFGEGSDSNLCAACHQGRESADDVNALTEGIDADTVSDELRFLNIHYFAAAATRFGGEARGGYQYEGKDYVGQFAHVPNFSECKQCHEPHGLTVQVQACTGCHPSVENSEEGLQAIRMTDTDFDGDGDTDEGIAAEVDTLRAALYAAIQAYAGEVVESPVVYDAHSYPYYFNDTNANGEPDEGEASYGNRYATWTPRLLRAAYNYQYATKDPGGFAHNGKYVIQLLYDSLADMATVVDVETAGMVRP